MLAGGLCAQELGEATAPTLIDEDITPPKLIHKVEPEFPLEGREAGVADATVVLQELTKQGVHRVAQFNLGSLYYRGAGVKRDLETALKWFRASAAQDLPQAQATLGNFYLRGEGVPQSDQIAVEWLRKAAEQGDSGKRAIC